MQQSKQPKLRTEWGSGEQHLMLY